MGGGPQWRMSASLSLSLNFSVAMIEDMRKLKVDYEKGLISYNRAKIQLERDVRKLYHRMLLMQENIALIRGSFENIERQVQTAQANYNAGLVPELTLLRAQVGRENMRPAIDQAENGLKLLMAQFAMSLGMDYNTQFSLIPVEENIDIIPFDVAQMISRAAANKPEIQELRQDILSLNSTRKSTTLRLFTPSISLGLNFDPTFLGDPWKNSWFDFDNWKQQSGMLRLTLGFRLNGLLPFSAERQGLKRLEDGIRAANIGLAQMIQGTEIEIYNIILELERTRLSIEVQEQAARVAEQAYRLGEQAYRAGLQDYSQVESDLQSMHQARVNMLEQQFNYLNGLIDLEYATGVPFGTLSKRSR
jgi:outer membrane protein TolC